MEEINGMKKYLLIIGWLVGMGDFGFGQNPLVKQLDKDFGGYSTDDLYSFQQTSDGGYILGGTSVSGIGGDKTQPSWGGGDYWIVKTDSIGNKQWDKDFGGTSIEWLFSVQETADGGFILGGYSYSDSSGDKTQNAWGTSGDYWIVKTDSLGNKQWDKDFGGYSIDDLTSLQQTSDGGYILGGYSVSEIGGDKTQPNWDPSGNTEDYWIVKTDSLGNKQWDKDFGGTNYDYFCSFQQTIDGGYILGGYSNSGIGGDKTQPSWGLWDYWIVKTDPLGNKLWDKDFGGTNDEGFFGNISQTADGGYLLAGSSYSDSSGNKTENNLGSEQTWIVKTDSLGIKQWDKTLHTTGQDQFGFAIQTKDGCFAMANGTYGGIGGDKTQPNWDTLCFLQCTYDYWIIKFCDSTATTSITQLPNTQLPFSIYPNPTTDFINISFTSAEEKKMEVAVFDLWGRRVSPTQPPRRGGVPAHNSGKQEIKIDMRRLPQGIYFVKIISGDFSETKKIVKL